MKKILVFVSIISSIIALFKRNSGIVNIKIKTIDNIVVAGNESDKDSRDTGGSGRSGIIKPIAKT